MGRGSGSGRGGFSSLGLSGSERVGSLELKGGVGSSQGSTSVGVTGLGTGGTGGPCLWQGRGWSVTSRSGLPVVGLRGGIGTSVSSGSLTGLRLREATSVRLLDESEAGMPPKLLLLQVNWPEHAAVYTALFVIAVCHCPGAP